MEERITTLERRYNVMDRHLSDFTQMQRPVITQCSTQAFEYGFSSCILGAHVTSPNYM